MAKVRADLLYASSDDADVFYLGGVQVPDAFVALRDERGSVAVLSTLEYDRVRRTGRFDEVLALEEVAERAKKQYKVEQVGPVHLVRLLAKERGIGGFRVAERFPAGLALELKAAKEKVEVAGPTLFPERAHKTDAEAKAIEEANGIVAWGFKAAEKLLKEAEIRKGKLYHGGKLLTSERVRAAIDVACLERGALPGETIVAGGRQGCDPHERGSGPLRANELIIIDIFPRATKTGYHGDLTRTYLKGTPTDAQVNLVETVKRGQELALGMIEAGVKGAQIDAAVRKLFGEAGFETGKRSGANVGFIHGLGHGLGLEVHEGPRLNRLGPPLEAGHVVTVEPGLYYPEVGGCRWEDVVRVTASGAQMLSKHPYKWRVR